MFEPYLIRAIVLVLILSGVPLLVSSCVGITVAIIQASTQVQEQTVAFLVKVSAVSVVLALGAPWAMRSCVEFIQELFQSLALFGRLA